MSNSFKICQTHFSRGGEKSSKGGFASPGYGPDSTPVPLFLFRMRTAQQSQTRSHSLAQFWTCRWAVQNWSAFVTRWQPGKEKQWWRQECNKYGKLIPDARFEKPV